MMDTKIVSETLGSCLELTRLVARQDFIVFRGIHRRVVAPSKFLAALEHSPRRGVTHAYAVFWGYVFRCARML